MAAMHTVQAAMYMILSPGYFVRNHLQNTLHIFIDRGPREAFRAFTFGGKAAAEDLTRALGFVPDFAAGFGKAGAEAPSIARLGGLALSGRAEDAAGKVVVAGAVNEALDAAVARLPMDDIARLGEDNTRLLRYYIRSERDVERGVAKFVEAQGTSQRVLSNLTDEELTILSKHRSTRDVENILAQAQHKAWRRYPDSRGEELREALARHIGRAPDEVIAGNGSNEIIQALVLASIRAGDGILSVEPTFTLYRLMGRITEARFEVVELDADLRYDVEGLLRAQAALAPRLTVLAAPNNPTGSRLEIADIVRLAEGSSGLLAVDEAYVEFSRTPTGALELLDRFDNLVLFRTFSKAWSAAGLRIGYGITNAALAREIDKVRLPYNVGVFTRCAAMGLLEAHEALGAQVREILQVRDAALERMRRIPGIRVYDTDANFILFECLARDAKAVFADLLARGVMIRDVSSYPKLGRALRVSVGTPEEMDEFLAALDAVAG